MKALNYHKWGIANSDATIEERKAMEMVHKAKSFPIGMVVDGVYLNHNDIPFISEGSILNAKQPEV